MRLNFPPPDHPPPAEPSAAILAKIHVKLREQNTTPGLHSPGLDTNSKHTASSSQGKAKGVKDGSIRRKKRAAVRCSDGEESAGEGDVWGGHQIYEISVWIHYIALTLIMYPTPDLSTPDLLISMTLHLPSLRRLGTTVITASLLPSP